MSIQYFCYRLVGHDCADNPFNVLVTTTSVLGKVCSPDAPGGDCYAFGGTGHCLVTVDGSPCYWGNNTVRADLTVTQVYEDCTGATPFACA